MKVVMQTYKTKPVEIQAVEWNGDNDVFLFLQKWSNGIIYRETRNVLRINTLEGVMEGMIGDYIIKGLRGEFYPCKPDVFEQKYEAVGDPHNDMWPEKGFEVLRITEMPLERTNHEKMLELMDKVYDVIYMRSEQWVKLMGESLVPADKKIYYRGVEVRFEAGNAN